MVFMYLFARNGDTNIENGLVGTAGEEWCEMNWDSSTDMYTLPCVKQPASGKPLCNTGNSAWCSVMT